MSFDESLKSCTYFLSGCTGGLGGCILYKLTVILGASKVYVLCRGSGARAKLKMTKNMPKQTKQILETKKIVFVVGDITKPNFGISHDVLAEMEQQVQVVIHCAANISFHAGLDEVVRDNCLPTLEFARMVSSFERLQHFVQISTAFCNCFLPDGPVEEKIYPLGDPESELAEILETGSSEYLHLFAQPYHYSKHLMERLLMLRYPHLPILIVRPSCISEALYEPYPLYGPEGSCPLTTFMLYYIEDPGNSIWHAPPGKDSAENIFDIIPVDWVANLILLHVASSTMGIIHASAESYVPFTFDAMIAAVRDNVADDVKKRLPPFKFVQDTSVEQCPAASFFRIGTRDWRFSNKASKHLKSVEGSLSLAIGDHSPEKFLGNGTTKVVHALDERKKKADKRAAGM